MRVDKINVNEFLNEIGCPVSIVNTNCSESDFNKADKMSHVEVSPFINLPNQVFVSEIDGHVVVSAFKIEKSIWLTDWNVQANRLPHNAILRGSETIWFVNKIKKINVKILMPGLNIISHVRQGRVDVADIQG